MNKAEEGIGARSFLVGILVCALLTLAPSALAQDDAAQYDFDIPRLPVGEAVSEFHLQTLLPIGYLPSSPEEDQTLIGPLKGRYTAIRALELLLKPVGFSFRWDGSSTIAVLSPEKARAADPSDPAAGKERKLPSAWGAKGKSTEIEKVIVTAGRIRDAEDSAAFVRTFNRRAIERSGAVTIADLFRYVSQQPYFFAEGSQVNGAQFADLRGLGPSMTLILINGRRALPSAANVITDAFDLNTIPITAVDRVQVLPDAASALYGTDAIGGVVNIVLRRDVPHPTADLHYGDADGGGDQRRASLSMGYRRPNMNAALFADYIDTSKLLGAERDRWRDQDYRRFGGSDQRSINSSPGNITSLLPGNLPGLPDRFAAVPRGSHGATPTTTDFLATSGLRNLESLGQYASALPKTRRLSVLSSGEIEVTPRLLASGEILHVDRRAEVQSHPPFLPGVRIPASNAFNPFGVPVVANVLLAGMEPVQLIVESTLTRGGGGLRGQWSAWEWEAAALRSHERAYTWTDGMPDPSRMMAALAQSDPNHALNVFQDGPAGSPELLTSLLADRKINRLVSKGTQVSAFASGPLPFGITAGPLTLLAGGEWREEVAEFDASLGAFARNVTAGFAELKVPLVSRNMQLPAIEELSLAVSARHDDYSDFGTILNPQYGLVWRINRDVTLRSSCGRSFRPPSQHELFQPKLSAPVQIMDPRRGELAGVVLTRGGNIELQPMRADSFTAGITFAPTTVPGLDISANYWRVAVDDRVSSPLVAIVLANEEEAAVRDRVVRAEPTPADIAAGRPGPLRSIDISYANLGRLTASGIDLGVAHSMDTELGRFTPSVSATWIDDFETTDVPFLPAYDRVNVAHASGTIVRWRVVPRLDWERGIAAASVSVRYTPVYDDAAGNMRTGRHVRSQTIVDIQASIDLGEHGDEKSMWRGFRIAAGASNVFDEHAPFSEQAGNAGFDWTQGDLKGRLIYVRLGKNF